MKKDLIAHEDPKSHVSELFRTLRTNIQFMNSNKKLKSILITSTLPGEGKSWVASNLAIAFAQTGKRVVLVDADMRKCGLHSIFKVESCPGLSNYLSGINYNNVQDENIQEYLRITEVANLYLIPAGNVPPNPSELLASHRMIELLRELNEKFDLVIIDGTPSKLVTDAVVLSRIVDSTIIVVGHNMSKKDDLTKVTRDIKSVGGNIAGIVYNQKPVANKKNTETYYYASNPAKTKQEIEYEQKRQAQKSRTTDMLQRDRNPEETQRKAIEKQTKDNEKYEEKPNEKTSEVKTEDILKQLNEYLQKEKENRDNRS